MAGSTPLITCMTISQAPRLRHLAHAIHDFCAQTWARKELLIVLDDPEYSREVHKLIERIDGEIYVLDCADRASLGKLRNFALEHANGELVCQWDDDDRYSPERLQLQATVLLEDGASACFLYQQLHFFESTRQLFWTDWRLCYGRQTIQAPDCWVPGTVLFCRGSARYPEQGNLSVRGEDSVLAFALWNDGAIAIETPPGTYVRIFHGNNTWSQEHHLALAQCRSQNVGTVFAWRSRLEDVTRKFGLDSPVSLMAGAEIAYQIKGSSELHKQS